MSQDKAAKPMCFNQREQNIDAKCFAYVNCLDECSFSFQHTDTSNNGLYVCLCDRLPLSSRFADVHWERTGHSIYLRVVRDPQSGSTRYRLLRLPTMRMIPLEVDFDVDGYKVKAGDGITELPQSIVKAITDTLMNMSSADSFSALDKVEMTPQMTEHAEAVLATVDGEVPFSFTPIKSIGGRSSYLSTICEALFFMPEFREVYGKSTNITQIFERGPENPALSAVMQMAKLGSGLFSSTYNSMRGGVPPITLKRLLDMAMEVPSNLVGKEQDPSFSFEELINLLISEEYKFFRMSSCHALSFQFANEDRIVSDKTQLVAYRWKNDVVLRLPIPKVEGGKVSFYHCLNKFVEPKVYEHPAFTGEFAAHYTRSLATFPIMLAISLDRLDRSGNSVDETPVDMPEEIDLDSLRSHGGVQPSEEFWDENPDVPNSFAFKVGSFEYMEHFYVGKRMLLRTADPVLLRLMSNAGYSEEDASKAIVIAQDKWQKEHPGVLGTVDVKDALLWLLKNQSDLGLYFNDNCETDDGDSQKKASRARASSAEDRSDLENQLIGSGFNPKHVKKALRIFTNSYDRAVEYILSNMDQLLTEDEREAEEEKRRLEREREERIQKMLNRKAQRRKPKYPPNSGQSQYEVFAVISHISTESSLNHFVLHVRCPVSSKWILCDGARFALAEKPPLDSGCFYLYRQKSQ